MTNTYEVSYGQDVIRYDDLDHWQRTANPWTLTIRNKNGRTVAQFPYWTGPAITEDPEPEDILASLRMDAHLGKQSFEDFCGDLGYDTDSRAAERTWRACREIGDRLRRIGEPDEPTEEDWER